MTAFEKKVTQLANRHGWPIRKLERASIPCYIVTAESYEDFCKITAALNRCKTLHYQIIYSSSGFRHIVEVFDAVQWNASSIVKCLPPKALSAPLFPKNAQKNKPGRNRVDFFRVYFNYSV